MGLKKYFGLALIASLMVSGCSSVKEELKPAPLQTIEAKLRLNRQWVRELSSGQDSRYARLAPAHASGKIITVDVYGKLSAVDAKSGKRLWTSKIGREIGGGVGLAGNLGLVGTLDGHVVAFDVEDGIVKWQAKASSEIVSAPQGNGNVVIAVGIDGKVQAYDVGSGKALWSYDHPVPILTLRSNADPLVNDTHAFIAFDNGQLLSFDAQKGQLLWSARIGQPKGKTELERLVDADSAPQEYGPYIYAAGYNGRIVATARGTGRISWAQDVATFHDFAISDNVVVVVNEDSHVQAFDAQTGNLLWKNDELHRRGLSAPAVFGSAVIMVDNQGFVHGLTLADGKMVARTRVSSVAVYGQPLVVDNLIYFYDVNGVLSAHSLQQGTFSGGIWDIPTGRERGAIPTKYTGINRPQ